MATSQYDTTDDVQHERHVLLDRGDEWDWTLIAEDGELTASKAIPYDGVLRYQTETRHVPRGRNSVAGLTVEEVVDRLDDESDISRDDIEAAIETARAGGVL